MRTEPQDLENAALRAFVDDVVGPGWIAEDRSRTAGRQSIVWRVRTADGDGCYVKRHEARKLFDRTVAAYDAWIPGLGAAAWFEVPELWGVSQELCALVMSEIPGVVVAEGGLSADEEQAAYELAGRFVARVHALPLDRPRSLSWPEIWQHRVAQWLPLAAAAVDVQTMAWAYDLATIRPSEPRRPVVATHSDCSPRNWIVRRASAGLVLGVIDWERARPSMWIEDVWRMVYDYWHDAPALRRVWFRGYGQEPDAHDRLWIRRFAVVHCLGGIVWAREHHDEPFEALLRTILERVRA